MLSSLTNLTKLYLDGTQVSDISALSRISSLNRLYLYGTKVSDKAINEFHEARASLGLEKVVIKS